MYMIELTEKKMEDLSEHIEKALKYMGKAMQCVSAAMEEGGMGERSRRNSSDYGSRYDNYAMRGGMGYREEEDDEDWDEMGERRRRSRRSGRYM